MSSRPAALAHVEATQRPWPWGPGDSGEGKARFHGLTCWGFSSETEGEGERETCPLTKVTVPPYKGHCSPWRHQAQGSDILPQCPLVPPAHQGLGVWESETT